MSGPHRHMQPAAVQEVLRGIREMEAQAGCTLTALDISNHTHWAHQESDELLAYIASFLTRPHNALAALNLDGINCSLVGIQAILDAVRAVSAEGPAGAQSKLSAVSFAGNPLLELMAGHGASSRRHRLRNTMEALIWEAAIASFPLRSVEALRAVRGDGHAPDHTPPAVSSYAAGTPSPAPTAFNLGFLFLKAEALPTGLSPLTSPNTKAASSAPLFPRSKNHRIPQKDEAKVFRALNLAFATNRTVQTLDFSSIAMDSAAFDDVVTRFLQHLPTELPLSTLLFADNLIPDVASLLGLLLRPSLDVEDADNPAPRPLAHLKLISFRNNCLQAHNLKLFQELLVRPERAGLTIDVTGNEDCRPDAELRAAVGSRLQYSS
eukprot:NODE_686_length_1855_cov_8.203212_g557_i0.p1 GENE.NODE_686_length_1855_cov_8.203212_g557_i0~~NODE_686_length_1855_cov_8.203212_g557_i0.p1  ORF type:complete len:379 (-),score=94.97 NODE_686_length_1855_cov_8.203212_g557_i0:64-1200(-)